MNEAREAVRKFAEQITGWQVNDTHIKKISVRAFSSRIRKNVFSDIRVGEELDLSLSSFPHEPVLAIFESDKYLVVTPDKLKSNRRVYLFERREVVGVEKE